MKREQRSGIIMRGGLDFRRRKCSNESILSYGGIRREKRDKIIDEIGEIKR